MTLCHQESRQPIRFKPNPGPSDGRAAMFPISHTSRHRQAWDRCTSSYNTHIVGVSRSIGLFFVRVAYGLTVCRLSTNKHLRTTVMLGMSVYMPCRARRAVARVYRIDRIRRTWKHVARRPCHLRQQYFFAHDNVEQAYTQS